MKFLLTSAELKNKHIADALDDETALAIDGDTITIIGEGEYWISKL